MKREPYVIAGAGTPPYSVIPGRALARTWNLGIPGSMLCIAPE